MDNAKPILVIVPGFGVNSVMMRGLLRYLGKYFDVRCIDLPGFMPGTTALPKITLESYASYVESRLPEFASDRFLIAGLSFGYAVVSAMRLPPECMGIIAIAPYINESILGFSPIRKLLMRNGIRLLLALRLHEFLWHSGLMRFLLSGPGASAGRIDFLLAHADPRAFFETARLILFNRTPRNPQSVPHVVIMNGGDDIIKPEVVRKVFRGMENIMELPITLEHYPPKMNKRYLARHIPSGHFGKIYGFFGLR